MFSDVIKREDDGYRRGVVLGLTIAEVAILLLFCLLLTVVLLLNMKERQLAELQKAVGGAAYVVAPEILQQMQVSYGLITSQSEIDDYFQKLFTAAQAAKALQVAGISPDPAGNYNAVVKDLTDQAQAARNAVSASGQP